METMLLLFGAGLLAGAMNAAAGGGTFVTLPALVATGVPSVAANVSSTVALLPGTLASALAWRSEFRSFEGVSIRLLLAISLLGGLAGAALLLLTPNSAFDGILPWLLLLGTLAFAFGRQAGALLRRHVALGPGAVVAAQVVLSIYGGYFGGAVGIMMMAVWSLLSEVDIKAMSAARTLLVSAMNSVAVLCFALFGPVHWPATLAVLLGAVIGGYGGALLARMVPAPVLRGFVILYGAAMTAVFFWRAHG
ncbi:sulfite exporter TauE/SafE family protein [Roseomonas sp. NAR14]|uniref:Probable membrane transporter protein n=1 Tax=Roseomonas acroporae TaxID=2937791 RepID=A0A9X2BZ58_9PROT|nr:sulfite exporter TauE/SafE family protein [Roseomonas acroporae]MCK8786720.1 sulfite exporter TauE/SafE family protein [Roseomonas acroporae]